MKLRVLLLEDSPLKAVAITRAIRNRCDADIEKVEDVTTGLNRIEQAEKEGCGYDLAISDMHYPLSPGLKADWESEIGDLLDKRRKEIGEGEKF